MLKKYNAVYQQNLAGTKQDWVNFNCDKTHFLGACKLETNKIEFSIKIFLH